MTLTKSAFCIACLLACLSLVYCSSSRRTVGSIPSPTKQQESVVVRKLPSATKTDAFLEQLLDQHPSYFADIVKNHDSLGVQIIYTQINRESNNNPILNNYYYNVNAANYFYPASTVKLPVALLALQRLNELKVGGLDRNTTMITDSAWEGETIMLNDPTSRDGRPTVGQYVKNIFLTSDNNAFNRLYEFLGQDYINKHLYAMGYKDAQIRHRLDVYGSDEQNSHTNPVRFLDGGNRVLLDQPMQVGMMGWQPRADSLGKAWYKGSTLVQGPMDFSKKNRLSLPDLHNLLRSIVLPNTVSPSERFNISADDYRFVYRCMSALPSETRFPAYDSADVWDAYVKFLLLGGQKGAVPKNIRIFNKVGEAYGFLIDVAYVVDLDKKVEFMLSAVINCATEGVLNNDQYDYAGVGLPFMKHLGEIIYQYELQRHRDNIPDLSAFRLTYDK